MSMETMRRIQRYNDSLDASLDQYADEQAKKRSEKLNSDETERRATELHAAVTAEIMSNAHRMRRGFSSVPLKTHPECVIEAVIAKFAAKGVKADHVYNEHHPKIDVLNIDLSTVKLI